MDHGASIRRGSPRAPRAPASPARESSIGDHDVAVHVRVRVGCQKADDLGDALDRPKPADGNRAADGRQFFFREIGARELGIDETRRDCIHEYAARTELYRSDASERIQASLAG